MRRPRRGTLVQQDAAGGQAVLPQVPAGRRAEDRGGALLVQVIVKCRTRSKSIGLR